MKRCECGCGQPAPIAKVTVARHGWVRGQPKRFVLGHYRLGAPRCPKARFRDAVPSRPANGCWEWQGPKSRGYGVMSVGGKNTKAHRYSYEVHNGPIPDGLMVLHACDNPGCVNPRHLRVGTARDNARDAVSRGRTRVPLLRGERCGKSKLTAQQVDEIRELRRQGLTLKKIGARYNTHFSNVSVIARGKTWKEAA